MSVSITNRKPTQKHRLAIVPGILGTFYGVNAAGEARYFDYDRDAAYAWAGITDESDVRLSRPNGNFQYVRSGSLEANPRRATRCLWVLNVTK